MAEVTDDGYQNLRDHIDGTSSVSWDWHSILDDSDPRNEITRRDTGDTTSEWVHGAGSQVLERQTTVSGDDADVSTPVTLEASALHETETDEDNLTQVETFASATIEQSDDVVEVTHEVEVPQV